MLRSRDSRPARGGFEPKQHNSYGLLYVSVGSTAGQCTVVPVHRYSNPYLPTIRIIPRPVNTQECDGPGGGENEDENETETEGGSGGDYTYTYDYRYTKGDYKLDYRYEYEWSEDAKQIGRAHV